MTLNRTIELLSKLTTWSMWWYARNVFCYKYPFSLPSVLGPRRPKKTLCSIICSSMYLCVVVSVTSRFIYPGCKHNRRWIYCWLHCIRQPNAHDKINKRPNKYKDISKSLSAAFYIHVLVPFASLIFHSMKLLLFWMRCLLSYFGHVERSTFIFLLNFH